MNIQFISCQRSGKLGEIGIDMNKKHHFYEVSSDCIPGLIKSLIETPIIGYRELNLIGRKIEILTPGTLGMGDVQQYEEFLCAK